MSHGIDSALLARYFAETCSAEEKARTLSLGARRSSAARICAPDARAVKGCRGAPSPVERRRRMREGGRARQQGVVAEGASHVTRRKVAIDQYLAWTHDRLVFKAAPFDEVAAELERWYNLTVDLTVPSERVNRLHASFHDEPLNEVLNVIAGALSLK